MRVHVYGLVEGKACVCVGGGRALRTCPQAMDAVWPRAMDAVWPTPWPCSRFMMTGLGLWDRSGEKMSHEVQGWHENLL
eukprot:350661-Chlamydomonas_euryale.AAC.5